MIRLPARLQRFVPLDGAAVLAMFCTASIALADGDALAEPNYLPMQISADSCPQPADEDWAERAARRSLTPQLGLPPLVYPADNPPTATRIALGRQIFFDRALSINNTMSCAMCHVPEQGFANWELATSVGVEGRSVKRNAPSLINVGLLNPLFHDGRDPMLETQFIGPLTARNEMANPSAGRVVFHLQTDNAYDSLFKEAFGAPASLDRIGMALAAYQRALTVGNSPFDRWFYGGDPSAVPPSAKRGFELFRDKAGCASCHSVGPEDALFTDQQFHDTGYGQMRELERQNPPKTLPVQVAPGVIHHVDYDLVRAVSGPRDADLGRYEVTEDPQDRWRFRTPTLRNLLVSPPYMHDGGFSTLAEVIDYYDSGGAGLPGQDPRVRPLDLSDREKTELLAFLSTLTSSELDCLVAEARQP
ncbi:cytochrome-c peroxidase [Phaeobacter gallaeciensis]|uniref:Methylamine utilization protein MauG n=1 Tax=Phaeobacter gallaeciensis TaxID=60890 RepID=A0AAC9ZB04_9RHOB|nr:cytochrome c peroxidase [Phaeobacter gallaeciensis]AHD10511.1 Cytochrome c peroxidase [Phaeobacter gallaeciensis DSM 26640]ATE93774.1 Cytochrome c peroxidase [Phaeobacter gallaeciensis]ATE96405.1 Cytochrome c peroxidase [Phaeobacter gallaeciensis]ATF02438.1 Cytochrome c peroxidase [Phaeobacter gallaeciensis]ATF06818.1 Cytochrome c peroxidase [Phaeobacter gallaeciensis]